MKTVKLVLLVIAFATSSCTQEKKTTKEKQTIKENLVDKDYLIAVLDTIWKTEQQPIVSRDSLMKIYGAESEEVKKQQEICTRNHKINEKKVTAILDTYGWPAKEIIEEQGNLTICNVIQHSDNEVRKKYLVLMKKAVKEKKLAPRLLARTEDRIATENGELQIYGGQVKYYPETKSFNVWPVFDPINIDKRRMEIGLGPITEFLKNRFDFEWNLEEQIKRTTDFEMKRIKNKK